jgi:hypothetical protein
MRLSPLSDVDTFTATILDRERGGGTEEEEEQKRQRRRRDLDTFAQGVNNSPLSFAVISC